MLQCYPELPVLGISDTGKLMQALSCLKESCGGYEVVRVEEARLTIKSPSTQPWHSFFGPLAESPTFLAI